MFLMKHAYHQTVLVRVVLHEQNGSTEEEAGGKERRIEEAEKEDLGHILTQQKGRVSVVCHQGEQN